VISASILVHHGNLFAGRRPEQLIEVMSLVDRRFHLTLNVDAGPARCRGRLRVLAASPRQHHYVPPVPMAEIRGRSTLVSISHSCAPPASFNDRMALPKSSRVHPSALGVVVGPSPEMARIVVDEGGRGGSWVRTAVVAATLNA